MKIRGRGGKRETQHGKKIFLPLLIISLILASTPSVNAAEIVWTTDQLTTDTATDWDPCSRQILQATDGTIWIVWASNRMENFDIFYKTSSDGGDTWSNYTRLTTYTYDDDYPSIMQTANGTIWVIWAREIMAPVYQWDLYYKTSSDGGDNWSAETPLTEDPNFDMVPSITETSEGNILVVWQSDRIWVWDPIENENVPQDDLYYKTSTDGGVTWLDDMRLTTEMIIVNETAEETTIVNDRDPSVTETSDGKIWIVWASNRYEYCHLFYKTSSDGGATWSNETQQLTTYASNNLSPSITQTIDETIWVVWHSRRELNYDIFYKTSSDGGANWSNDTRLTTHPKFDVAPSITQTTDGKIWIVWASNRAENYDIWYMTTPPTVVHDVAITSITPNPTIVIQGETISIDVTTTNEGTEPETFNVTVYADTNNTVIGDEITIGTQTITNLTPNTTTTLTLNWKTTNIFPDNYTISATADPINGETDLTDNTLSDVTVQIKMLGDIDGDGDVDGEDYWLFSGAYGTSLGEPAYNPAADLNGDGSVDGADYYLFSGNFGAIIFRDVAITNMTHPSTPIYQRNQVNIIVDVKNEGTIRETFNVTLRANSTTIGTQTVPNLAPNASTTLTFTWNTTSTSPGNYTLSATAEPVPSEKDFTNNYLSAGIVQIRMLGDIDGDGDVDGDDYWLFSGAYGASLGEPAYNPAADLNGDGSVDGADYWLFSGSYGKSGL